VTVPPPGDPYAPQQPRTSGPDAATTAPADLPGPPVPTTGPSPYVSGAPADGAGPYGSPAYGAPQPPTDGVSIGALVTGVLGMALIPLGLGIAGIVRTSGGKRRGKGLAIAGLVLGVLSTIVWGFVVAGLMFVATNQDAFGESLQEGLSEALEEQTGTNLVVGNCFEAPADLTSGDPLQAVDCAEPHSSEVVGVLELADGDFPGLDAVVTQAEAGCLEQFASYVGVEYAESTLNVVYFHPTEVSWTLGDRKVICGAGMMDGTPLTETVAGSGL
jgi:hypothetical protein